MAKRKKRIAEPGSIQVVAKTPAALPPASRGFYQLEEEVLYVPVYPTGKFYSYLDSPHMQFDVDRAGRLVFIQILVPRRNWRVRRNLKAPAGLIDADIRFRGFREHLPDAAVITDPKRSLVLLQFKRSRQPISYKLADHLLVDVAPDSTLVGVWVTAIGDDRASRIMAAWRKNIRKHFERQPYDPRMRRYEVKR